MSPSQPATRRFVSALRGPAIAFVAIAIATGVRLAIGRFVLEDAEVVFLAAVTVAAWFGGPRAGAAAVVLSSLAQLYFFIAPFQSFRIERTSDALRLLAWMAVSAFLCFVIHARERASAKAARAEATAREIERANVDVRRETKVRAKAEEALRLTSEANRLLFDASPTPMFVVDSAGERFLDVNRAALALYGYDRAAFLSTSPSIVSPPKERDTPSSMPAHVSLHRTRAGDPLRVEISERDVQFAGRLARFVSAKDVTQRDRLEQQLRHAQKMKAVGQLAGGIAHDFNNLLFIILGSVSNMLDETDERHVHHEDLVAIKRAAERSAELTKQLLVFSRQEVQAMAPLDLGVATTEMMRLLDRPSGDDGIQIITDLDPRLPRTRMDPGQFQQILVNLVGNARHAMPKGGQIWIETKHVSFDASFAKQNPGVAAGSYVMLAVSDNGAGMDAKTVARVFEPFFTTKEPGSGTGLGLSIVFGIVEDCGGLIKVFSEPDRGTTFQLFFPALAEEASVSALAPADEPLAGIETVLVVEDEAPVRDLVRKVLEKRGYRVITAPRPSEALRIAGRDVANIDLLLTDVIMPEMNGRELADEMRLLRPNLNVLYMSGFTNAVSLEDDAPLGGPAFLQKPMTPNALIAGVRRALDSRIDLRAEATAD